MVVIEDGDNSGEVAVLVGIHAGVCATSGERCGEAVRSSAKVPSLVCSLSDTTDVECDPRSTPLATILGPPLV